MAITEGTTLLHSWIQESSVFGSATLLGVAIIFISLTIITRDAHKWKRLALPLTMGWWIAGALNNMTGILLIIITAIIAIVDAFSLTGAAGAFKSKEKIQEKIDKARKKAGGNKGGGKKA